MFLVHRSAFAIWLGCLVGGVLLTAGPVCAEDDSSTPSVQPISSVSPATREGTVADKADEVKIANQVFLIDPDQHVWSRFPVGSWREIQITTETSGSDGTSLGRSVTTQIEKLKSVTGDRYALDVQATINVVGKRVVGQWMTRVLNTATDEAGQVLESHRLTDEFLDLPAGEVECQVWDVVYTQDSRTLVDHIYFAPDEFPHVLRRETAAASVEEGGLGPVLQTESIVARDVPFTVAGKTWLCTCQQIVQRETKGSTVRIAMLSPAVPGGEVAVWLTDFDTEGRRSRWSHQELVSFGEQPRFEKPLTRREMRRARRKRQ